MNTMRGLLLSAYEAGSHEQWVRGVRACVPAEWTVYTLPPRHFLWRIRGNPLSWYQELNRGAQNQNFDFVLCTSMVDLSTLRGLCPWLCRVPNYVYFHENQFVYPTRNGTVDANLAILNLYTALSADTVFFNSAFNLESMIQGVQEFLGRMPDHVPSGIPDALRSKASILPVGIDRPDRTVEGGASLGQAKPLQLIWNHRWEYDKAPERLFNAIEELDKRDVPFIIDVVGQSFRQVPACFDSGKSRWKKYIRHWGYLDKQEYRQALADADIVLSTAIHEFQGLSVLNGMAYGCIPIVPDRLAYKDIIPSNWRYPSWMDAPKQEACCLVDCLLRVVQEGGHTSRIRETVAPYFWDVLAEHYQQHFLNGGGL